MVQLIIPGAAQVVIKGECSGQEVINVIGLNVAGTVSAESLANAVKTAYEATGGPLALKPTQFKMVSYKAMKLEANGAVAEVASAKTGGSSVPSLSTMAASALIILGGGTRSRSSRGRLYHGPLGETQIDADGRSINATYATQLQSAYNVFSNSIAASGHSWAVLSRKDSLARPVSQLTVASIIATQRRRLR